MSVLKNLKWISFVSSRFSRVDRKGKSAVTSYLASLGICFGVMTLIVVMAVMNGFQMSFIDAILEISSYHVRVDGYNSGTLDNAEFPEISRYVKNVTPFYEAQALLVSKNGKQSAAIVRAVPENNLEADSGFQRQLNIRSGTFDLKNDNSVVLGSELASTLGVRIGDKVNFFALSGGNDVALLDKERIFIVTGIFRSGYSDINSAYCFIGLDDGKKYFGENAKLSYGLKLHNLKNDATVIKLLENKGFKAVSWKNYNRSFFNALKIEKNILLLLVCLIFIVVSVNIFNGIRRIIFERKMEISIFSSFGGTKRAIQSIFIFQGFLIGLKGAVPGLILGLLISNNMRSVFFAISHAVYGIQYLACFIFNHSALVFLRENPMFAVYAQIPARNFPPEVVFITLFGIFSALIAAYVASKNILDMQVAEVLRDE